METITAGAVKLEIWHKAYNLEKRDNLNEVPSGKAIFGVFGIVNEEPVNCRYVGAATNLQKAIKELFENPPGEGLKKFMQGPWIQMLQYELMLEATAEELQQAAGEWIKKYEPNIDEEGEYPGYYEQ